MTTHNNDDQPGTDPDAESWAVSSWKRFCRLVVRVFYRRFEVSGKESLPAVVACAETGRNMSLPRTIVIMIWLVLCLPLAQPAYSQMHEECVIVLHGMGRTRMSMGLIEDALTEEGYRVWNASYPSRSAPVETLAVDAINKGLAFCRQPLSRKIHFVTHSLGGILIRYYLQDHDINELGRIVMLSPPNQGSEVVDALRDNYFYQAAMGPAGLQIGTGEHSLPNELQPIPGDIGIITGNSTSDPWFSPIIPGDDDGKVSVERAKLDEMDDFLVVENGHTFIMRDDVVIRQIMYFLKNGKFERH